MVKIIKPGDFTGLASNYSKYRPDYSKSVLDAIKGLIKKNIDVEGSNVLVMGLTFKENCPDYRNTKVIDIIDELTLGFGKNTLGETSNRILTSYNN